MGRTILGCGGGNRAEDEDASVLRGNRAEDEDASVLRASESVRPPVFEFPTFSAGSPPTEEQFEDFIANFDNILTTVKDTAVACYDRLVGGDPGGDEKNIYGQCKNEACNQNTASISKEDCRAQIDQLLGEALGEKTFDEFTSCDMSTPDKALACVNTAEAKVWDTLPKTVDDDGNEVSFYTRKEAKAEFEKSIGRNKGVASMTSCLNGTVLTETRKADCMNTAKDELIALQIPAEKVLFVLKRAVEANVVASYKKCTIELEQSEAECKLLSEKTFNNSGGFSDRWEYTFEKVKLLADFTSETKLVEKNSTQYAFECCHCPESAIEKSAWQTILGTFVPAGCNILSSTDLVLYDNGDCKSLEGSSDFDSIECRDSAMGKFVNDTIAAAFVADVASKITRRRLGSRLLNDPDPEVVGSVDVVYTTVAVDVDEAPDNTDSGAGAMVPSLLALMSAFLFV